MKLAGISATQHRIQILRTHKCTRQMQATAGWLCRCCVGSKHPGAHLELDVDNSLWYRVQRGAQRNPFKKRIMQCSQCAAPGHGPHALGTLPSNLASTPGLHIRRESSRAGRVKNCWQTERLCGAWHAASLGTLPNTFDGTLRARRHSATRLHRAHTIPLPPDPHTTLLL